MQIAGGPGEIDQFTQFLETWGWLRKNSGSRNLETGDIVENLRYTLDVRYNSELHNEILNSATRSIKVVTGNGRKFTIVTLGLEQEDKNRFIRFELNETR